MAKQTRRKDSRGIVLEKGEGQRKDGRYYYEWTDWAKVRHFVYGKTLEELREKEKAVTLGLLTGIPFDGANMTLNDLVELWKHSRAEDVTIGALKATTFNQYLSAYEKHVQKPLGNLKIKDITKGKLASFYKRKMAEGLGMSQISNMAKPINQALEIAEDEGLIGRSPAKGALKAARKADGKRRDPHRKEIKALTEAQQELLLGWLENRPDRTPLTCVVKTLLFTGLRIGELAALQEQDVSERFLVVRHSLAYFNDKASGADRMVRVMQKPKTKSGNRAVPLLKPASDAIETQRAWACEHGVSLAEPIGGFRDFVFLTRKGWPLTSSSVNYALQRAVRAINREQEEKGDPLTLPPVSCHWLRRTFATRLCEAGVSMKVAQHVLGHEHIGMTADVYTAVQQDFASAEMAKLMERDTRAMPTSIQQAYSKISLF